MHVVVDVAVVVVVVVVAAGAAAGAAAAAWLALVVSALIPASVVCAQTLLGNRRRVGRQAFRAPNQGLESSLRCRTAGQDLERKDCLCHIYIYTIYIYIYI